MKTESVSPTSPTNFSTKKNRDDYETDNTRLCAEHIKGMPRIITGDVLKAVGQKDVIYAAAAEVALKRGILVLES